VKRSRIGTALAVIVLAGACAKPDPDAFQGYAEGEYVRVAAPFAGTLQVLSVARGAQVRVDDPLFTLERENEAAARNEAEERVRNADAQLADLRKAKRPSEIEAIRAQLDQAQAALKLSAATLKRQEELVAQHFVSAEATDTARSQYERDRGHVTELEAQLKTAQLSARPDEIRAAEFNAQAARAVLAQADWKLAQKVVHSTVAGVVNDTNFVTGEWVPAGAPVVSVLPPQNIKVRFFVPETRLGALKPGMRVTLACDGCGATIPAAITFIAPQAEYTPPVIYSRESSAKLVYLIEARAGPEDAVKLHPGQPVEVRLAR
jgi:HlyD family secretion protein